MTRKRWRNPDKRMVRAVELRQQGWSLRRIGSELAVSEGTIRNDLARWEREAPLRNCSVIQLRNYASTTQSIRSEITQESKGEEAG